MRPHRLTLLWAALVAPTAAPAQPAPALVEPPGAGPTQPPPASAEPPRIVSTPIGPTQPAPAPAAPPADAAAADNGTTLHPALIAEDGFGPVVLYLSDTFRRSAPAAPQPLIVITLQRSNPGDAFNSPATDMNRLHPYLRGKPGFAERDLVALASSRDVLRLFFRGERDTLPAGFAFPRAALSKGTPADWARMRAVGIADFARYLARRAVLQTQAMRLLLGDRAPVAEGLRTGLRLDIEVPGPAHGRRLAAALQGRRFEGVDLKALAGPALNRVQVQAQFAFSEDRLQRLMTGLCADAAKGGGECVDWALRFEPVHLKL